MDVLVEHSDAEGLQRLLLLIIAAGVLWYCLRIALALALIGLARQRPGLRAAAVRSAPAALRPLIGRVLIGGLLGAGLASPAAWADPAACPAEGSELPALDRADPCRTDARPALTIAPPAAEHGPAPSGAAATGQPDDGVDTPQLHVVTVTAGDSLWSISGRLLGPTAAPADIAAAWPLLWDQNRSAIGPDPDLIHPGTELRVPAERLAEVLR